MAIVKYRLVDKYKRVCIDNALEETVTYFLEDRKRRGTDISRDKVYRIDNDLEPEEWKYCKAEEYLDTNPLLSEEEKIKAVQTETVTKSKRSSNKGTGKKRNKITKEMIFKIREETGEFFSNPLKKGKVLVYRRLAAELHLGVETVSKIARGNIYAEVK